MEINKNKTEYSSRKLENGYEDSIAPRKTFSQKNLKDLSYLQFYPLFSEEDRSLFRSFHKLRHFAFSDQKLKGQDKRDVLAADFPCLTPSKTNVKSIAQINSPVRRLAKVGDTVWVLSMGKKPQLRENQKDNTPKNTCANNRNPSSSKSKSCTKLITSSTRRETVRAAIVHKIQGETLWASFFDGSEIAQMSIKQCRLFLDWFQRVLLDPSLEKDTDLQLEIEAALAYYRQTNPFQSPRVQWLPNQTWSHHVKEILQNFGPSPRARVGLERWREVERAQSPDKRKRKYCMLLEHQVLQQEKKEQATGGVSFSRRATGASVEAVIDCIRAESDGGFDLKRLEALLSDHHLLPTEAMLVEAVRSNNLPALMYLLAKMAEQGQSELVMCRTSETRSTLLHEAADSGAVDVIPTLVLAMQRAMDWGSSSTKQARSQKCSSPGSLTDKFGKTPLHVAAQRGATEALCLLLHTGDDLEARDSDGYTPLMWCAESGAGSNHAKCASLLLQAGTKVNCADRRGMTTLFWAVSYGLDSLVPVLVAHGGHYYEPLQCAPVPLSCGNKKKKNGNLNGSTNLLTAAAALTSKQRYALAQYAKDISLNLEAPVAVKLGAGTVEEALAFPPFGYISESIGNPDTAGRDMKGRGCDCKMDCRTNPNCRCIQQNGQRSPYGADGTLDLERTIIYECGNWCACVDCTLVQSQMSLQVPVRVTYLEKKGWGLFYDGKCIMKRGTFLCCYVGEIITKGEYEDRELSRLNKGDETTYAIVVDQRGINNQFVIDSRYVGNASRLMNHSCQSNLVLRKIFTSRLYPSLAFFASRDILPGEELTWNYDRQIDNKKSEKTGVRCMCGAKKCKGYL